MGRAITLTIVGIMVLVGFSIYWVWNAESLSESIGIWLWIAIFAGVIVVLPLFAMYWFSRKTVVFMGGGKRSKQIRISGRPATATILSIGEVSSRASVTTDGQPYLRLVLRIDDRTVPPYEVSINTTIRHYQLAQFQPGATFAVRVDQDDPQAVVIAPDDPVPNLAGTTFDSAPGSQPTIIAEGWSQTDLIKLERDGKQGLATVVAAAATGRFEGTNPIEQIDYEILLPGEEPYAVSKQVGLPPTVIPQIESTVGRSFPVTVHPDDPEKIRISFTF